MKRFLALPLLFTFCAAASAATEAVPAYEAFDGVHVGASVGGSVNISDGHANYRYTNLFAGVLDASDNRTTDFRASDRSDFVHSLETGFSYAVSDRFLLGITGSYFFETTREVRTQGYTFSNPNNRTDFPQGYSVLTRIDPNSHFSIGLEPGYLLTDDLLGFLSVSYHFMNADLTSTSDLNRTNMTAASTIVTEGTNRRSFNGIGLGGGFKYNVFMNCLLKVSAEWIVFGSESAHLPRFSSAPDEISFTQTGKIQPSWVNIMAGFSYTFG